MKREIMYSIPKEFDQTTVEYFLKSKLYTHQALVNLKKTSESVLLNGKWVYLNTKIITGDELKIVVLENADSPKILPYKKEIDIVYEDEDLLIINKSSNMPIHPSLNNYEKTVANALMDYFCKQGESFMFRCINRLDRDTTGLTMVAKHFVSAGILNTMMEKRKIQRSYVALCEGMCLKDGFEEINLQSRNNSDKPNVIKTRCGRIDLPIFREDGSLIKRCIDERGERAITNYRHIHKINGIDMVEFLLETGRTHQIRVHMSALGHPLLGDEMYGGNCEKIKRTALHAKSLEFKHPIDEKHIRVEANLHDDMLRLLQS